MKVGILTFHDGINYGAFMQVYSLQQVLRDMGHDVRILNYKNFKHWYEEYKVFLRVGKKSLAKLKMNLQKIRKFHVAQKNLSMTPFTFRIGRLNSAHFDAIVIGSDEVWNYHNLLFGHDPAYFGHGLKAPRVVSYAPSFGRITADADVPESVREGIRAMTAVSVRDGNSQRLAEQILGRNVPIVLDPTLLYDVRPQTIPCPHDDFILFYAATPPSREVIEEVKAYAQARQKKLLSLGYDYGWCDLSVVSVGPFEWLGYFEKADTVITTMFHGTLFSIKYEKTFCTLLTAYRANKLTAVLTALGLEDRLYNGAGNLRTILETPVDYNFINPRLEREAERSRAFLREALAAPAPRKAEPGVLVREH